MVAITKLFGTPQKHSDATEAGQPIAGGAIAKLKVLHAEAEETAHLANLLGRSLYAGIAMPVLAILTIALSVEASPVQQLIWAGLVSLIAVAVLKSYRHAMREPFERATLKNFAKDLSATLFFAGFAWGAGAFLTLPENTPALAAVLFAALPGVFIAYLLRNQEALVLFLAPVAALTAAASILKPFAGGWQLAVMVVAVNAAIAGISIAYGRLAGERSKPAMLSLP
jgi:hypothetical protein